VKEPRILVDFDELVEPDLVLLSQTDSKDDSDGNPVSLHAGLRVKIYEPDFGADGQPDCLVAEGSVELNTGAVSWTKAAKWCCRIDGRGILHESEDRAQPAA